MRRLPAHRPGRLDLLLPYTPPYDWAAMFVFLRTHAVPGVEQVAGLTYRRTILLGGVPAVLEVTPEPHRPALRASVAASEAFPTDGVAERLARMFDLDADPAAIGAFLAADPALTPLVAERPGLRLPGAWDGFELALRAVLGQQISVAAATALGGKLSAAHGGRLDGSDAALCRLFPTAGAVAAIDPAGLPMPRSRAATVIAIAAAALAEPDLLAPPGAGLDETVRRLRLIRGIGDWTAHYIAMRLFRHSDAFPAGDIALQRELADAAGARPDARALLARAEAWRPYRAYAAQHLWARALSRLAAAGEAPTAAAAASP